MTHSLRLAFMGSPKFAAVALEAVHRAGHDIAAVYCQPPKPAGRGQQVHKTATQVAAEALDLPVFTPKSLRDAAEQERFAALNLDVAVVAAYGLILPEAILAAPKFGCLNIHGSLLPRWRGAAPLQRAILAGDTETGITIMQMDAGLDTGAMLLKEGTPITAQTTAESLHDTMAAIGARLILKALDDLSENRLTPEAQLQTGATYAAKLTRDDGKIDWTRPAIEIDRQIRALNPWPGCYFMLQGEAIKVFAAEVISGQGGVAGDLLDERMTIACGEQALRLISMQRPGKKPTDGASFLNGLRLSDGSRLTSVIR